MNMGMKNKNLSASISLLVLLSLICNSKADVFDVTSYGAKAGGQSDIRQAFLNAWKEACSSPNPSKIVIPKGTYLIGQVTVAGPCKAPIEVQVAGTLKAPADPGQFPIGDGWVTFNNVDRFTLSGGGVFDGQGAAAAWKQNDCSKSSHCHKLPTNIRFNFVTNALVHDVTTLDSKLFHVNVLGCKNLTFNKFTITAPGDSPNTDGIHIGRSDGIYITESVIHTGDDCVSMGDGSKNIYIEKVTCGPGHGISVGSLGKYRNEEFVAGIFVKNCTLSNTTNGVRIKTWPDSHPGSASNMHFEDVIMDNVYNPVIVDQMYCPWNQCSKKAHSRIKLSDISFKNIRGTSSSQVVVQLTCSAAYPCQKVEIGDINLVYNALTPGATGNSSISQCANVKPIFSGRQNIPICSK